jgi:hypothetical protein
MSKQHIEECVRTSLEVTETTPTLPGHLRHDGAGGQPLLEVVMQRVNSPMRPNGWG